MVAITITAILCVSLLLAHWLWLRAQPRADRWQEMERVLSTLETRCKVLEQAKVGHSDAIADHYARFDTLKGQHYAPLEALAELREELSRRYHSILEIEAQGAKNQAAMVSLTTEVNRRFEQLNQLSHTVGTLAQRGMRA